MAKNSRLIRNDYVLAESVKRKAKVGGLKTKFTDQSLPVEERFSAMFGMQKLNRNGASVRYRNRCSSCGRSRGYHGFFGLCRCCVYNFFRAGVLFGTKKSSW